MGEKMGSIERGQSKAHNGSFAGTRGARWLAWSAEIAARHGRRTSRPDGTGGTGTVLARPQAFVTHVHRWQVIARAHYPAIRLAIQPIMGRAGLDGLPPSAKPQQAQAR